MKILDPTILEALAQYDSATVQNAAAVVRGYIPAVMDYSGPSLRRLTSEETVVVGYAVTAELTPLMEPLEKISWEGYYDTIAYLGAPSIAALKDVDQPPGRGAILGDGMAYRHRALGCVGAVVDGSVRDVPGIEQAGLPSWGTGRVPGHGPFNILRHGEPVDIAGLRVTQGDILVCDGDGVTRLDPDIAADVVKAAAEVREKEGSLHRYFSAPDFTTERYEQWKRERGM